MTTDIWTVPQPALEPIVRPAPAPPAADRRPDYQGGSSASAHLTYRGRETETTALGRIWKISRCDLDTWDTFFAWARKQLPDPLKVAEDAILRLMKHARQTKDRDDLDAVEKKFLLEANAVQQEAIQRIAMDKACSYLAMDSPEFQSLLRTPRGSAKLMALLLSQHQPDVTEQTALEIVQEIGEAETIRIAEVTQGKSGGGKPAVGNGSALAAS